MTTQKPEALRLASELVWVKHTADWTVCDEASIELRRLHAELELQTALVAEAQAMTAKVCAENEALQFKLESQTAATQAAAHSNEALRADEGRYRFIRGGGAYIESVGSEIYMATDVGCKYYADLRDMDLDIDAAIDAARKEGSAA